MNDRKGQKRMGKKVRKLGHNKTPNRHLNAGVACDFVDTIGFPRTELNTVSEFDAFYQSLLQYITKFA